MIVAPSVKACGVEAYIGVLIAVALIVAAEKLPLASLFTSEFIVLLAVAAAMVVFNEVILEVFDTIFVFKLLIEFVLEVMLVVFELKLLVNKLILEA